ncbi:MAG TPA: universal stress protein [Hyphomicrobiaceae bacterium]|nr:universal stress protein [Hyphomicrobiaceae bacterium]
MAQLTANTRAQTGTAPTLVVIARDAGTEGLDARLLDMVGPGSRIVLLAVEPEPDLVRTRGIMKETVARQLTIAAGMRLEPIRHKMAAAGIETLEEVRLSDRPASILDAAKKHGCRTIVVPCRPTTGARRRWVLATGCVGYHIGACLAALSDIPVIVLPVGASG